MEQETPRRIPADDPDREQYLDHSFDLGARVRTARETAQREMEAFGDVSEYEIRKIYGQRTDIRYDDVEKTAEETTPSPRGEREPATEHQSSSLKESDSRQSAFDFKAADVTHQPRREEE
jgi:hypothetical protein